MVLYDDFWGEFVWGWSFVVAVQLQTFCGTEGGEERSALHRDCPGWDQVAQVCEYLNDQMGREQVWNIHAMISRSAVTSQSVVSHSNWLYIL